MVIIGNYHHVKSVRIRSFSGSYFPAFGLNTGRYRVSLRIPSECGKIRTRKSPNTDTFHAVYGNYYYKVLFKRGNTASIHHSPYFKSMLHTNPEFMWFYLSHRENSFRRGQGVYLPNIKSIYYGMNIVHLRGFLMENYLAKHVKDRK